MPPPELVVPEPFASAIGGAPAAPVVDLPADTPAARFGRGLVRALCGRLDDARDDFSAATATYPDECALELASLDVTLRRDVEAAAARASAIADRSGVPLALRARALHVAGLAEARRRRSDRARQALLDATEAYRALGDRRGRARVWDTLAQVEAASGRVEHALPLLALSVVDKTMAGDRHGVAIAIGNLGRCQLQIGRFRDAIECFEHDLALATSLGDRVGIARMQADLGRAHLALGEPAHAVALLDVAVAEATALELDYMAVLSRKDLALAHLALGDVERAEAELAQARRASAVESEPGSAALLDWVEGEIRLHAGDARGAVALLEDSSDRLADADYPDFELGARLALGRALAACDRPGRAAHVLVAAIECAQRDGHLRYFAPLNEALTALDIVPTAVEERGRLPRRGEPAPPNGYRFLERLGGGGFGEVFRTYDPARTMEVALKIIHLGRIYDGAERRRLTTSARLELEAASRVRHPGVVRVYAVGTEDDGDLYIVQDLVEGQPLRARMPADASADVAEVLDVLGRVAHALAALHDAGVVHRDLKPDNVIVRSDGSPVLIDFGIAHATHALATLPDDVVLGTLAYMAPEQARGQRVDGRADLYALGVTTFEWLTGIRPLRLRGDSMEDLLADLADREPDRLSAYRPGVDAELESLVAWLLEKKPRRRPGTALEVAETFTRIAGRLAVGP